LLLVSAVPTYLFRVSTASSYTWLLFCTLWFGNFAETPFLSAGSPGLRLVSVAPERNGPWASSGRHVGWLSEPSWAGRCCCPGNSWTAGALLRANTCVVLFPFFLSLFIPSFCSTKKILSHSFLICRCLLFVLRFVCPTPDHSPEKSGPLLARDCWAPPGAFVLVFRFMPLLLSSFLLCVTSRWPSGCPSFYIDIYGLSAFAMRHFLTRHVHLPSSLSPIASPLGGYLSDRQRGRAS